MAKQRLSMTDNADRAKHLCKSKKVISLPLNNFFGEISEMSSKFIGQSLYLSLYLL